MESIPRLTLLAPGFAIGTRPFQNTHSSALGTEPARTAGELLPITPQWPCKCEGRGSGRPRPASYRHGGPVPFRSWPRRMLVVSRHCMDGGWGLGLAYV